LADIPHLALPLRVVDGRFVYTEQDSPEEIQHCAEVVLRYPIGQLDHLPSFGRDDPTFTTSDPASDLAAVVEEWEPRAEALVASERDRFDEALLRVTAELADG
jgi:hypothetical protein